MLFCYKDFVSLPTDFILTKREPENSLSVEADMKAKVGNVVQLFPRRYSADFCHIPPSRFLRTSVAEYRHEVCALKRLWHYSK